MRSLDSINADAYQQHNVVLDDKTIAVLTLRYMPAVQRWFIDIVHATLTVKSLCLFNHPNILRQYRHTAGLGLAVVVNDGADPLLQDDFTSGRAIIYLLNEADIQEMESYFFL